jgi:hypothetical protein
MPRAHNHAEPVANQHSLRFIIRPEQGAWERAVDANPRASRVNVQSSALPKA